MNPGSKPETRPLPPVSADVGMAFGMRIGKLDSDEPEDRRLVFDIPMPGSRPTQAIDRVSLQPALAPLSIGMFSASTGAAAALVAATRRPEVVAAVVARGARRDLALDQLPAVQAPSLLTVGAEDHEVLELSRIAAGALGCACQIEVVPGVTHLFEEAGALEGVAVLASACFETRFGAAYRPQAG